MQFPRKNIVSTRRDEYAYERPEIRRRDYAPFILWTRTMLDERVQRHRKKAAKKSEERQIHRRAHHRLVRKVKHGAKNGHANRAQRNQSVFDFSSGKISRRDAPHANPDSHRSLEKTDVRFV